MGHRATTTPASTQNARNATTSARSNPWVIPSPLRPDPPKHGPHRYNPVPAPLRSAGTLSQFHEGDLSSRDRGPPSDTPRRRTGRHTTVMGRWRQVLYSISDLPRAEGCSAPESATVWPTRARKTPSKSPLGKPFEVQAANRRSASWTGAGSVHDLRMEWIDASGVAHARHAYAHSAHARPNGALRQVAVPIFTEARSPECGRNGRGPGIP